MSQTPPSGPPDAAPPARLSAETADRTGLIREAYRIEGITAAECRSIFLDWAIKLGPGIDSGVAVRFLLDLYGQPGHPMTEVLTEALAAPARRGRRGGWRSRAR